MHHLINLREPEFYILLKYDKYKDNGIGTINNIVPSNILFICLPSPYDNVNQCFDTSSL